MSIVQKVFNLVEEDSFQNFFEVSFLNIPSELSVLSGLKDTIKFRIQNFTIPAIEFGTYDVFYLGQKVTKINNLLEYDKTFTFDMRIDKYWKYYQAFTLYRDLVFNKKTSYRSDDNKNKNLRFTILVKPINPLDTKPITTKINWKFLGCILKGLNEVSFSYENGEPIIATVSMNFLDVEEVSV